MGFSKFCDIQIWAHERLLKECWSSLIRMPETQSVKQASIGSEYTYSLKTDGSKQTI